MLHHLQLNPERAIFMSWDLLLPTYYRDKPETPPDVWRPPAEFGKTSDPNPAKGYPLG